MMKMTIMMITMMMIIAVTQSTFKLGPPDFAWQQIQIVPTEEVDEEEEEDDNDENDNKA